MSQMSHEDALAALKVARTEAAEYRRKAKELDDLKRAEADAKLSETEKLQQQVAAKDAELLALTQQTRERILRVEVGAVARELGLKPELARKLIDSAAITFSDDGDPDNIRELLQKAIEDYGLSIAPPSAASAAE